MWTNTRATMNREDGWDHDAQDDKHPPSMMGKGQGRWPRPWCPGQQTCFFLLYYHSFNLLWCIQAPPLPPSKTTAATGTRDATMHLGSFGMFFFFLFLWYIFSYFIIASTYLNASDYHYHHPQKQQGLRHVASWAPGMIFFFCYFTMLMSFKSSYYYKWRPQG